MMTGLILIILISTIFIAFAHEFHEGAAKLLAIAIVRNVFFLLLLTLLVLYYRYEFAKVIWWLLFYLMHFIAYLRGLLHLSGWLSVIASILGFALFTTVPWLVFHGLYFLIRKKEFPYTVQAIWTTWIILIVAALKR